MIRNLVRSWRGRAAILCYHRVLKKDVIDRDICPLKNMAVSEANFNKQMKFLKKNYNVISMDQLIDHLNSQSKEFVVAITFDDGYKDNFTCALPILEFYELPSTFFITTRFPEKDCGMYWYELWELIERKKNISITNDNQIYFYNLVGDQNKIDAFNSISNIIEKEKPDIQKEIMLKIRGNIKAKDYSHICLTWDELKKISQSPKLTIGSHGHSHLSFGILNIDEKKTELHLSKNLIEKNLGIKVNHFAYPFGQIKDFNQNDKNLFYDLEYSSACLAFPNKIKYNSFNRYQLPRIAIRDEPINIFNAKINGLDNFFSILKNKSL
jgi:peptidoglycan/xylan/chitin deacetylase (PgdA/CDA1 family)